MDNVLRWRMDRWYDSDTLVDGLSSGLAELLGNDFSASGGLHYSHKYFFEIKKKLLNRQKKGEHKGIRYITNIDSSNVEIAKLYLAAGIKIKQD